MLTAVPKVLVRVMLWPELEVPTTWLLNVRLDGRRFTPEAFPVPVRLTVCGLVAALSLTVSVPVRVPPAFGVKVTLIEQVDPAASILPQLLLWPKSPLVVMPEISRGAVPGLLRETVSGLLVVLTGCEPKVRLAGESDAAEANVIFAAQASPLPPPNDLCTDPEEVGRSVEVVSPLM